MLPGGFFITFEVSHIYGRSMRTYLGSNASLKLLNGPNRASFPNVSLEEVYSVSKDELCAADL